MSVHGQGALSRDAVITRMCALATLVGEKRFGDHEAHDCFCPMGVSDDFRFSAVVLEYIEKALKEGLGVK